MSAPSDDTFTHTTKTGDGELRISEVHGRIHETFRSRTSRIPVTAQMELADAAEHYQRGVELVKLAQAARAARAGERGEA
ncbi:hypothetical protein [Methylobacterium sp. J-092]|uniref:hypothetical protein n=1 Tax=Methylobacterium sp. J-092 TaxID=2836667 RepID=UPI001FB9D1FE|nr:hypothetical protein [Methylobacterium sp. J-092]MCJ2009778.1 hypothetical protein [Methylobacterium sp. J-092]